MKEAKRKAGGNGRVSKKRGSAKRQGRTALRKRCAYSRVASLVPMLKVRLRRGVHCHTAPLAGPTASAASTTRRSISKKTGRPAHPARSTLPID